jgi:hypothetical protein
MLNNLIVFAILLLQQDVGAENQWLHVQIGQLGKR